MRDGSYTPQFELEYRGHTFFITMALWDVVSSGSVSSLTLCFLSVLFLKNSAVEFELPYKMYRHVFFFQNDLLDIEGVAGMLNLCYYIENRAGNNTMTPNQ